MAISFPSKPITKKIKSLAEYQKGKLREGRLIFEHAADNGIEWIAFFEQVLAGS